MLNLKTRETIKITMKKSNIKRIYTTKKDKYDKRNKCDKKNKYNRKKYCDENFQAKVYLIHDHDEKQRCKNEKLFTDDCENYDQSQNLQYFNSNYDVDNSNNFDVTILIILTEFVCRRCVHVFLFNNRFHKHICKCVKFALSIDSTNSSVLIEVYTNNTHNAVFLIRFHKFK